MKKFEKGQSLLEALVALAAAVVVITAITTAVVAALRNAQTSRNQDQAAQLAQEGMEYMRQARSQYYDQFKTIALSPPAPPKCLSDAGVSQQPSLGLTPIGNCSTPNVGKTFIRFISFNVNPNNCKSPGGLDKSVLITVTVEWAEGYCDSSDPYCAKSQLVSCFTPYNILPAP